MFFVGTRDETIPASHSKLMAEALAAKNIKHDLILVDDAPHTFDYMMLSRDAPGWKESIGRAFEFVAPYAARGDSE